MTTFNSSIDLDEDILVETVIESSDFESKVERIVDSYDMSDKISDAMSDYDFDYDIDRVLDRYNLPDADDFVSDDELPRSMISAIQKSPDLQYEIRIAAAVEAADANTDERVLSMIRTVHSACGKIAQQMAIMNAMTGISVWPNEVTSELQSIASTLMSFGIDVTKTNEQ